MYSQIDKKQQPVRKTQKPEVSEEPKVHEPEVVLTHEAEKDNNPTMNSVVEELENCFPSQSTIL